MERKKVIENLSEEQLLEILHDLEYKGAKVTKEKCIDGTWRLTAEYDEAESDNMEEACSESDGIEPWWEDDA